MPKSVKRKLSKLLEGLEIGFFDTCKNWEEGTNEHYYKYFNNKDKEIRGGSILAFASMLGNWYNGSADVFQTRTEQRAHYLPKEQFYFFDEYLAAYLKYLSFIKKDYPHLHSYIVFYLYNLDKRERFEIIFPQTDQELFEKTRTQLFFRQDIPTDSIDLPIFNDLLREVGLPTFFKG